MGIEETERWVRSGGHWRQLDVSREAAVVELCTCTGEPMKRVESDDPAVIGYLPTVHTELNG